MPRRTLSAAAPERSTYGARLRAARTALGLTQQQVADQLGVDRSYVVRMETGRVLESWPTWLAMVTRLGYDPALVAPELVVNRPLVSPNHVSDQSRQAADKKPEPNGHQ